MLISIGLYVFNVVCAARLAKKISMTQLMPDQYKAESIQLLWEAFASLICRLKQTYTDDETINKFEVDIKLWLGDFNKLYQTSSVTPYRHAFSQHIPEFLKLYGNVNYFNQHGLEKYNYQCSKDYFRSTNHRNMEALRQMLLKKNRMQYLQIIGIERVINGYKCSNCNENGHNLKT